MKSNSTIDIMYFGYMRGVHVLQCRFAGFHKECCFDGRVTHFLIMHVNINSRKGGQCLMVDNV